MILNNENAYVGAIVTFNGEKHYVVKVNAKSVYLTKEKDFLKKWETRPKGVTWKSFCEKHNAFMNKYEGIEISEAEASAKDNFIEAKKSNKRFLNSIEEKEAMFLFNEAIKAKQNKKHKNWTAPSIHGFYLIDVNIDKRIFIARKGTNRFFYDIDNDIYFSFEKDENNKVIWPEKIKEEEKVA